MLPINFDLLEPELIEPQLDKVLERMNKGVSVLSEWMNRHGEGLPRSVAKYIAIPGIMGVATVTGMVTVGVGSAAWQATEGNLLARIGVVSGVSALTILNAYMLRWVHNDLRGIIQGNDDSEA